jgi:hypothetical protein
VLFRTEELSNSGFALARFIGQENLDHSGTPKKELSIGISFARFFVPWT